MDEKYLIFLEYLFEYLHKKYPEGDSLYCINEKYSYEKGMDQNFLSDADLHYLKDKYMNVYFEPCYSSGDSLKLTTEAIEIINNQGSLSKYLQNQVQNTIKTNNKNTIKYWIPIIIPSVIAIWAAYMTNRNLKLNDTIEKMKAELTTKDSIINDKDAAIKNNISIINNLEFQIDTLKIK